ncbi:DUF3515 family protein [Sphaerisporangium sp. TRM90804]|uniref:DUF3515 family protein n=1 Tax=Sphaerisporangium sp. TRM90804 TaxID=3031113 RepID=UPI00244C6994|nr:DUF3515 family protein [Sphaerisporangium sp. TRM90804]MDH2427602.1 DUF3515 family protein [Sphaerisporangium sp. TRM90804]
MRVVVARAAAAVVLVALAGCGGAVRVEPPTPSGVAAKACATLRDRLPRTLDGAERVPSEPPSPYVAVWGSGEIAVRCGVPRPAAMDPTQQIPEIDGVPWFPDPTRPALFTAITRDGYVEVTISAKHQAASVLVDLARPIRDSFAISAPA